MSRKQDLLRRHRRSKRIGLVCALAVLVAAGVFIAWWLPLLLAVLGWVAHEAWFADHLFYSPQQDYRYRFPADTVQPGFSLVDGVLRCEQALPEGATLIVALKLQCGLMGRFLDPGVELASGALSDCQTFERGARGLRYLNLSSFASVISTEGVRLRGRHCKLAGQPQGWVFEHPDYLAQRVMVVAPHADDAELAAFGLYSQARESWVVTLTAGEIEAEHYRAMGMPRSEAARLKGRLRAWDSIAVPRWGGVPEAHCVNLGYFCLQLPAMRAAPEQPVASREAELDDTRLFRQFNSFPLPGDDGVPCWNNLVADLKALILQARPQVIVLPHSSLDPHPDHIEARRAVLEALQGLEWQPAHLLGYANHLHDNDRWPMGNSHEGIALPPVFEPGAALIPYSAELSLAQRRDKAMALGMMHDLQPPLPLKRRIRRSLQRALAGRRWALEGENEFFRKTVRQHELLWRDDASL